MAKSCKRFSFEIKDYKKGQIMQMPRRTLDKLKGH